MKSVFVGSRGIRAGWRLLIFFLITSVSLLAMVAVALAIAHFAHHQSVRSVIAPTLTGAPSASVAFVSAAMTFGAALIAASVMARIERRPMHAYGLPIAPAWARNVAEGALAGFVTLSLTLAAMYLIGALRFDGLRESGISLLIDAFAWAAAFAAVALSEEFLFRGYALFTLTTGTGFRLAAVLMSLGFALLHAMNPGETAQGIATVVVFALVLSLAIWRTGNLWFGVGFHAAWDWGETYFYGTPDSGLVTSHALLVTTVRGPAWLSGSTAGPEGSIFAIAALLCVAVYLSFRYTGRLYPWRSIAVAKPASA